MPSVAPPTESSGVARALFDEIWTALASNGAADGPDVRFAGTGDLPSVFAVTDLAAASVAAAGAALATFMALDGGKAPPVEIDRRLASMWFALSIRPRGWELPPAWDAIAGDYRAADGWIRLHTNAPHHRDRALAVLGAPAERDAVARAVSGWRKDDLETAIVEHGGCAAAMRSIAQWREHPQGRAIASEPLLHFTATDGNPRPWAVFRRDRPLAGVRVLDLTRVLAGPVATRFLAGYGADVLRLDPPWWDEPSLTPDVTPGKRRARLDLREREGREIFERLLAEADVFVHGYRADALETLGLGVEWRRRVRPGLVDVSLDAYGWSGPWRHRRGFDSLVQMSSGIADAGMVAAGRDVPTPLPVQALDHATGYIVAAAVIRGLTHRATTGVGSLTRASLARIAALLVAWPAAADRPGLAAERENDQQDFVEATAWGPARRLVAPLSVEGAPMRWDIPAGKLGDAPARW